MKVGFKIRKIRELRNYSQEFMALELGISQRSYSSIELDETSPTLERLGRIAALLQVSVTDIICFEPDTLFIPGMKKDEKFALAMLEKEFSALLQILQLKDEILELKNKEIELLKSKLTAP